MWQVRKPFLALGNDAHNWWDSDCSELALKYVHPKLHNINPHNVSHSLISWNPREQMLVVQISFLMVMFLSLISWMLSLMEPIKEVNPHPHIAPCVNMWSVTFLFFFSFSFSYATCWMLVHAYATSSGKVKWSGPHHTIKMLQCVLFHSVTCHTDSIVSCIHVNTT